MLKIRFKRYGRKKYAIYRIIVIDSRKRRDGKAIEEVGFYNPFTKEAKINIQRIEHRIANGAQVSCTVKNLIKKINHN
uniref:Small ribosomal subunit protein bS16c n=1 Tax=Calliarthron tuberculosum TaxID=48942 RepID=M4ITK7_CALTB|nr:30S ribosomal protein S16 [Calliarthron tuberculosum]AGA63780.1 30S ribosomal protein S16 [Calliarthron tuberculosum]